MSFTDVIHQAIQEEPVPVLGILAGCATGCIIVATSIVSKAWRAVRCREAEIELKQQMLEKGMSAEEIERVVQATADRKGKSR